MNRLSWLATAVIFAFGHAAIASPPATSTIIATASSSHLLAATPAHQPAPTTAAEVATWASKCKMPGVQHPFYVVLDGKAASLAQRQTVLAELEQCAQGGSVSAQNFLGALYWMGDALPAALVHSNSANARTYLSNAASHGDILDMAKLAEINLAEGHAESAMVWAQLYGHYKSEFPTKGAPRRGYLAELLTRIDASFNQSKLPDAIDHANTFVALYDADIRAYKAYWAQLRKHPSKSALRVRVQRHLPLPLQIGNSGQRPDAGFADYLIGFKPNGSVDDTWLIDAFPTIHTGRVLRPVAMSARAMPTDKPSLRFAVLPIVFNDRRYAVRKHG